MKHLWEFDHPYYCTEGNYYSNDCFDAYNQGWEQYYQEWKDYDIDLNLIWRWDAKLQENGKFFDLQFYKILQRKAILRSDYIYNIPVELEHKVRLYLIPFWKNMKKIWENINE